MQPVTDAENQRDPWLALEQEVTARKRVEEQLRQQTLRLEEQMRLSALYAEIGLALNRDRSLVELLQQCSEILLHSLGVDSVRIWTWNESNRFLELRGSAGLASPLTGEDARIPAGTAPIGLIAEARSPVFSNLVRPGESIADGPEPVPEWPTALAGYPLIHANRAVGVLALVSRSPLAPYPREALKVVVAALALGVVRKCEEEQLRVSESRQRAILNQALDCIITIDRFSRVIDFNPAAVRTFGYSREEAIGRSLAELLIPPEHRAGHQEGLLRHLNTGTSRILGERLVGLPALRKNGERFPTELTVIRLEEHGEPVFTAFLRDITNQHQLETERGRAAEELRAAKEQAEEADRAKTLFLANMSHEVRTPMVAVVGYGEMLLDPRLEASERMRVVHAINRNGRHLLALINEILDLSKIEAGKLDVEWHSCRLWQIVSEAMSVAGVGAQEQNVRLTATPVGRLPRTLTTDSTRFRQILDNLLSNAVKFTPAGRAVEVRILLTQCTQPALQIEVEDQGIGMSAEVVSRLFQAFTQADPSTTRRYGGTGLGLSITHKLVEILGGTIAVRSEPNVGSCFTVRLPLKPEDLIDLTAEDELAVESQLIRRPESTQRRLTGRVLIAEDSPDNRAIVQYFLERTGLKVELAENGQVAVEKARQCEYDLILMDMQMPILDGYTATSLLRQMGYGRSIVALTAHAMAGDEDRCLRAGCNAYLTKPVEADRLVSVVARFLPARSWAIRRDQTARKIHVVQESIQQSDLIASYRRALPQKLTDMLNAAQSQNWSLLADYAHRLAGSAGMYQFFEITETARLIELACRESQSEVLIRELLHEIELQIRAS